MQHKAVQLLTVISPSFDSSPSVSKPGSDAVGVEDDDGSAVEELSPRRRWSGEATSLSVSEESRPFFLGPHNSARLACLFATHVYIRVWGKPWVEQKNACAVQSTSDGRGWLGAKHEKWGGSAPLLKKWGCQSTPCPPSISAPWMGVAGWVASDRELCKASRQHEKWGGSAPPPQKVGVPKHPLPP